MKIVTCPVCCEDLIKTKTGCNCSNRHNYDFAKEGYVNLLLSNDKNSKNPGDNKEMMLARHSFLKAGFYEPLLSELINTIKALTTDESVVLEAGCGEGYYISGIKNVLYNIDAYGFDISKEAIKLASKKHKNVTFFVGSSYKPCIKPKSVNVLLVVFAPFVEDEFCKMIDDCGYVVVVKPRAEHLLEIKEQFYDLINETKKDAYNKFVPHKSFNLSYRIYPNINDLNNLFQMTPFYYQVGEKREKLSELDLKKGIKLDFFVEVLKKIKI